MQKREESERMESLNYILETTLGEKIKKMRRGSSIKTYNKHLIYSGIDLSHSVHFLVESKSLGPYELRIRRLPNKKGKRKRKRKS